MKLNIAYAPDDKYINQTIVSMISAIENNKGHEIEFIIIYSKLSKESIEKLYSVVPLTPNPSPSMGEGNCIQQMSVFQPSYIKDEGESNITPPPNPLPQGAGETVYNKRPYPNNTSQENSPQDSFPSAESQGTGKTPNVKLRLLQVEEYIFTSLPLSHWVTVQAWFRIKLPDMCPDLDKILYLDCDTLILGDLSELFKTNLDDKYLAGVKDVWGVDKYCKRLNIQSGVYVNSGMLLFNAEYCRNENFFEKIVEFANNNAKIIEFCDQDSINKIADDKKVVLHPKFNFMDTWWKGGYYEFEGQEEQDYLEAGRNPVIAHLTGLKPAFKGCENRFKDKWWEYAKLADIYTELQQDYDNSKIPQEPFKDKIFSIKNKYEGKIKIKVLTILGYRIVISKKGK